MQWLSSSAMSIQMHIVIILYILAASYLLPSYYCTSIFANLNDPQSYIDREELGKR